MNGYALRGHAASINVHAVSSPGCDFWLEGIVGCAGLLPTVEAIKKKKTIALANKETLIAGGPAVLPLLKEYGVDMIPADSEHSAIFQCLQVSFSVKKRYVEHRFCL